MKKRYGFISNSSSSSFIVGFSTLNFSKFDLAHAHKDEILRCGDEHEWEVDYYKGYLCATTHMTNFDFDEYLMSKYGMQTQNIISFGAHNGFSHSMQNLRSFIDTYLSRGGKK